MNAPVTTAEWAAQRRAAIDAMPEVIEAVGLPAVLLPYQQRAVSLLDNASTQALFVEKSRRIGLTWGLAAYAVLRAGRQKSARGMDVMYISYSREMTREFIDACAMWARSFDIACGDAEETLFDQDDEDKAINAFRIKFASGFEVMALSSAPRGLRGKQGVVIIDEAAFVDNLAELLKAALAFLMWGGQVVVCSTHDGAENPFNQTIQDILGGRLPYAHMRIDLDDALRDGLYQRIALVTGKEWTPEAEAGWRDSLIRFYGDGADEELFCIPSMSSGAWLPAPLIEARMTMDRKVLRLELPADFLHRSKLDQAILLAPFLADLAAAVKALDLSLHYGFGFDFGRVADLTVGVLMGIHQRLKRSVELVFELRGVPGDEQKSIVEYVLRAVRSRLVGAAFDATGMGWTVAEDMGRKFGLRDDPETGAGLILAIKFTEEWYRLHMPPLKVAFEDDQIALIKDQDQLSDLRAVKLIRGIPRVPPTREGEKGKRRHGDFAIGLALAHYATRMRWVEYSYTPVKARPSSRFDYPDNDDDTERDWWDPPAGADLRGSI